MAPGNIFITILILLCFAGCSADNSLSGPSETRITSSHPANLVNRQTSPSGTVSAESRSGPILVTEESGPELVRVQGKIKDSDGEGVGGVTVTLWTKSNDDKSSLTWRRIAQAESNKDGAYTIQGRGRDATAITARKEGLAIAAADDLKPLKDQIGKTANQVDLQLLQGSTITGQVITHDGNPIANAEILANSSEVPAAAIGEFITHTDAVGNFTFTNLPEGKLALAVAAPGRPIHLFESAAPNPELKLKLPEKVSRLDGRLISDDTDLYATTATISLVLQSSLYGLSLGSKLVTGEKGVFDFGAVPSSHAMLYVDSNPTGSLILETGNYTSGRPYYGVDLSDGASSTTLLKVTTGKTIRGIALDVTTSAPVAGVRIYPDGPSLRQKTNFAVTAADGTFTLPHATQMHFIQARAEGSYLFSPSIDKLKNHDISDTITLLMKQKPWVRGIVQNKHGAPIAGTKLSWYNLSPISPDATPIPLNPDGSFQLPLMPGKYRFFAEALGCAPAFVDKDLGDTDLNDIKLVMDKGRKISGIVVSPEGKPVAGALVLSQLGQKGTAGNSPYYPNGDTSFNLPFGKSITDATGRFSFSFAPADAGIGVIAKSNHYADSPVYFSDPDEGEIADVRLQFPPTGTIRGTVHDNNGMPVAGAALSLFNLNKFTGASETESSTSGTFELPKVEKSASLSLSVRAKDHANYNNIVQYTDEPLSITLTRHNVKSVTVKCIDIETGQPVPSKVSVTQRTGSDDLEVMADSDRPGTYQVSPVAVGETYIITAQADGYAVELEIIKASAEPIEEWTIALRPTAWVTGRIVDEKGSPLPDAWIADRFLRKKKTLADENGRFDIEIKDRYSYLYAETSDGQRSREINAELQAGAVTDLGDIVVIGQKEMTLRALKASGKPAVNVRVRVTQSEVEKVTSKTDRNGELKFSRHPAHSYNVELPEYNIIRSLSDTDQDANMEDVIIVHIGSGKFRGKLLANGKPVAGKVTGSNESFSNERVSYSVLNDGNFNITNLAPGRWRFSGSQASSPFDGTTVNITVKDDEVVQRDIELKDKVDITGTVVDETGRPVSKVRVAYTAPNGNGGAETDANGRFTVSHLGSGKYEFYAEQLPGKRSETVAVNIENSEAPEIRLVLKSGTGAIRCSALSILDGYQIASATAELTSIDGKTRIKSGTDHVGGEIIVESIPVGSYRLVIAAPGFSRAERTIEVADGEPAHYSEVLSPAASLSITVLTANGYVAGGIPITVTPTDAGSVATTLSGVTGDKGTIGFPAVESGTYLIQALGATGSASATVSTRHQRYINLKLMLSDNLSR